METKICKRCGKAKSLQSFPKTSGGKYIRGTCSRCKADRFSKETIEKINRRERARRAQDRSGTLWKESRSSDKKKNLANDLTKEFVAHAIKQPCAYCGDTDLLKSLDRVDNNIGHLMTNVNPCCVRCNYMRRDMPYPAWLAIVPSVREAREKGLFGTWTCSARRKRL